jgi:hypothetical protein
MPTQQEKLNKLKRIVDPIFAVKEDLALLSKKVENIQLIPGYSPVKGEDYWTNEDKKDILNKTIESIHLPLRNEVIELMKQFVPSCPKEKYPNESELLSIIKKMIPKPIKGTDGRTPMTVSKTEPLSPIIGDLWYQP